MALSNEIYVVHTLSNGDIAVGINELVNYKDMVKLVGYNSYNYHEYISQSLVNLTDQILLLKGGVAAQATHELEQAVADAKAVIDDKVNKINAAIGDIIATQATQIISETAEANILIRETQTTHSADIITNKNNIESHETRLDRIDEVLDTPITGLIPKVATHDSTLLNIQSTIGVKSNVNGSGTIIPGTGMLSDIEDLQLETLQINTLKTNYTELSKVVGTEFNSKDKSIAASLASVISIIFKDVMPANDIGRGLYVDMYSTNDGIIKRVTDLESLKTTIQTLSAESTSSGSALTSLISDNDENKSNISSLKNIVGLTATTGLQGRIKTLEDQDIANISSSNANNISNLQTIVGNSSSGLIKDNANNITKISNLTTNYTTLNDKVNVINTDISNIKSDITSLKTFDQNFAASVTTLFTKNTIVYNAAKLESMNNNIITLQNSNTDGQFNNYFYKTGAYVSEDKIGQPMLNAWIADTVAGMKIKTNNFISDYLASNTQFGKISTLETSVGNINNKINVLNGAIDVNGSISKKIDDALSTFKVDNINGLITTNTAQTNSINSLNLSFIDQASKIQILENKNLQVETALNEIENEAVRYSVIIPFIKKMILLSRRPEATDSDIIKTFDKIINNIAQISNDYDNNGSVTLTISNKTISYLLTPDDLDTFKVPELSAEYYIRIRFIINRDMLNSASSDVEYVTYLTSKAENPTLVLDPLTGSDSLTESLFYRMTRSSAFRRIGTQIINTPDTTTISDVKTFDELYAIMQSNPLMELYLDLGTNPIVNAVPTSTYNKDLFAVESFKVKII